MLAGEEGFEPSHAGIKIQCLNRLTTPQQRVLAGEEGFEPSHAGIKIQCLNRLTTPQLTKSYDTADEHLILPHNKLHMIEKPVGKLYVLLDEIHLL